MRKIISILSLSFTLMACGGGNSGKNNGSTDDVHEHGKQQLTLFTDSLEFFIEYPELRAGHESEFLVHLTRLPAYKPCSTGIVTITLDFGEKKSSTSSHFPVTPGIWKVQVVKENAGKCLIIFEYTKDGNAERAEFTTGGGAGHDHDPEQYHEDHTGNDRTEAADHPDVQACIPEMVIIGSPDGIRFTKEQAWKSDFAIAITEPVTFTGIIRAGGEILAMPGEKYYIHARNSGIVNYSKKGLVAGRYIEEGEEMMRIEGQDIAHDNIVVEFAEAESRFNKSNSEYQRRLSLIRENAVSEKEFIETRAAYLTDSIRYYNLRQSYADGGLKISSPIAGHIHELMVSQGEFVNTGQLIATVSSDRRLLLRADVPQQYFSRIGDIVSTNFRTSYQKTVFDISDFDGRLLAIGSSVKENNQYLPVYFEVQNNGELLEGAYTEFFLKTSPRENSLTVPVPAVLEELGKYYVYVQAAGETYQKREIKPGETDGFNYQVISGLSPGERIVTRGNMFLKAASMSTSLPGDSHQH